MDEEYTLDYVTPDFLQGQSADEIHARMLEALPQDISKEEGNIPWDFTRPPALEKAEMVEFTLNETIKIMFVAWAYGNWLDMHGERESVYRREANQASGILTVTGTPGTVIPSGFQFATTADITASVIFETTQEYTLAGEEDDDGNVTMEIAVSAVEGGTAGNVAADTIKIMVSPINDISYITNDEATSGGTETEDDEAYRARIIAKMRSGESATGCNADYIRWAKEVPGVGQAICDPEWNDPSLPEVFHYLDEFGRTRCAGAVRLILIDSNGLPANQQICDAVYLHIAGTGDKDIARLMPIGAHLTVSPPTGVTVDISATLILDDGADIETVTGLFMERIAAYWLEVGEEATENPEHTAYIRWVQVGAVLAKTMGVIDYTDLTINGSSANIAITQEQYPVTGEVTLNE